MTSAPDTSRSTRFRGPLLGIVAAVFTLLFLAGLFPVTSFGGAPYFPGPWEPANIITTFFQARPTAVLLCSFFQFGSAITLGIFSAAIVAQLRFLGVRVAGPNIALFGGFATSFNIMISAMILWVMAYPGIAQEPGVLRSLYYLSYAAGGPGFSVPIGLLFAGVCVPAYFFKLLPRWLVVFGMILAVIGELSWFNLVFPQALFLIPLTRFPGFVWMVAAGFALPRSTSRT